MAERKFSELPSAASLTGNELAALSQMQSGSLASVKSTLQAIANWFAVYAQYTTALQTTDKSIAGAINELKQLISLIPQFSIEVVEELPTEDISDTTIYLVPAEDPEVGNYYEEYIHVNNTWELVGTTAVDLSAYYTKLEVDGLLADKLEADDFEANQTASANPITFETKQAGLAKSCVVEMNPIQDLHGYDYPWVGGAGKNKLDLAHASLSKPSWYGGGWNEASLNSGNGLTLPRTYNQGGCGGFVIPAISGDFVLSIKGDGTSAYDCGVWYTTDGTDSIEIKGASSRMTAYGTARHYITFTIPATAQSVAFRPTCANNITTPYDIYDMMIESGSTPSATFAPYSNICPISGRTEASVTRTGINQWDEEWEVIGTNLRSKNYISVIEGKTYYRKSPSNLYIWTYDESHTEVGYFAWGKNGTFTIPSGVKYIKFMVDPAYGTTYNNDISINYPSTDTEYHASAGTETKTKEFGQTVYSGTLDLNSGLLTIDRKFVNAKDYTWLISDNVIYHNFDDVYAEVTTDTPTGRKPIVCNILDYTTSSIIGEGKIGFGGATNNKNICVNATQFVDLTTWNTYITNNDVQIVYYLATLIIIQLSPEAVTLLKGMNVISTDGDKVQVEFSDIPVGDYSVLLDYIKSLEARIAAVEP